MYKPSKYNIVCSDPGAEELIVFNSFTGAVVAIKSKLLKILETDRIDMAELGYEERSVALKLIKDRFLVRDYIDELKIIKHTSEKYKYDNASLYLTIAPTMDCNLTCTYCYENRSKTRMTGEVQQALLNYIEENTKKADTLKIIWFGGEPLLAWDMIESLTAQITGICEKNSCRCFYSMVTNGYLLDNHIISRMADLNYQVLQITLDGPPGIHNLRKGLAENDHDSYYKLLAHIRDLRDKKIEVYLRINISHENRDAADELLHILASEDINTSQIYPAMISSHSEACKSFEPSCLSLADYSDYLVAFHDSMIKKGFAKGYANLLPKRKANSCYANQNNSFLFDPEGYLYKCWYQIGSVEDSVGQLTAPNSNAKSKMNLVNWLTNNPFDDKVCRQCKLLPLCMGGCFYEAIYSQAGKKYRCLPVKKNLAKIVSNHYRYLQGL